MEVCRLSKRSFLPYIIHTQGLLLQGAGLNQTATTIALTSMCCLIMLHVAHQPSRRCKRGV